MTNIRIFVITHKEYDFPRDDIYIPIQVGKWSGQKDLGILSDDLGDNISIKNPYYCELTGLYWVWKNTKFSADDYVGFVHYRRYFAGKKLSIKGKHISSREEISDYLNGADCLVPLKRNYYIETVYSHYKHAHHIEDLDKIKEIIANKYDDYLETFDAVMQRKTLYLYNMFIMRRDLFDSYCSWLFDILFELENYLNISNYDSYQKRVFGFISERLFNVWLLKNNILIKEVKVVALERQNVFLKGVCFIRRKLIGRK